MNWLRQRGSGTEPIGIVVTAGTVGIVATAGIAATVETEQMAWDPPLSQVRGKNVLFEGVLLVLNKPIRGVLQRYGAD
ncbi:hypothetical protein RA28_07900 [Ruegeria sp. ANG-S4]|nr:hypothetical protein RA28_07900 [Ruegeria sp. ANG-S4]